MAVRELTGSSPHTRGALPQTGDRRSAARIIPAYAGSTLRGAADRRGGADHPRIRGEHRKGGKSLTINKGSSPHTRGAPCAQPRTPRNSRIIPAYAGSTRRSSPASEARADHPRIRGEHPLVDGIRQSLPGSSPHTRGARRLRHGDRAGARIIPAYAGSTRRRRARSAAMPDHPRIRGEHGALPDCGQARQGSSPHTRGAPARRRYPAVPPRIIPAYAGSTVERRQVPVDG